MKVKKILFAILMVAIFVGETGCVNIKTILRSKGDRAMAHLEKKYETEFTPTVYEKADFMSTTDEVRFYADGINAECEYGIIYIGTEDGKTTYKDNYFAFTIREEYEAKVKAIVKEEFDEVKVFAYNCKLLPDDLRVGSTVEDALYSGKRIYSSLRIYVALEQDITRDLFDKKCKIIEAKMNENKMVDCCYFYQVGVGITQNLTRENYLDYFDYMHPDGEIYIRKSY